MRQALALLWPILLAAVGLVLLPIMVVLEADGATFALAAGLLALGYGLGVRHSGRGWWR